MSTPLTADRMAEIAKRARRRVGLKLVLAVHALVYLLVNGGVWLLHAASGQGHFSRGMLLGWGLGLAIHSLVTLFGLSGDGLRQRMLDAEIETLRQRESGR